MWIKMNFFFVILYKSMRIEYNYLIIFEGTFVRFSACGVCRERRYLRLYAGTLFGSMIGKGSVDDEDAF